MTVGRILLLGGRSWIGYRLDEAIRLLRPACTVAGTSSGDDRKDGWMLARDATQFLAVVREWRPDAVVNLLRGEDEAGRETNRSVAGHCARHGIHYAFASSALALDGYSGVELTEDLPGRSVCAYGQFKAACESDLQRIGGQWLVLRFASIHGWSPWKPTRTEALLARLAAGERVLVDRGVRQNRLQDRAFAQMVAQCLVDRRTGVVHFGTTDGSEEVAFLRRLADAFGQCADRVVEGGERNVTLVVRPHRLIEWYGARYARTEGETIQALLSYTELRQYRSSEFFTCH